MEFDRFNNAIYTAEEIVTQLKASSEWSDFTFRFDMSNEGNKTLLEWVIEEKLGPDPDLDDYKNLLKAVIAAGGVVQVKGQQYEFETVPEPEQIVEPEVVPTDRNGRPLTPAQIAWSEYRTFSESNTMEACRQRAKTDAGYGSFFRKQYERQTGEVADAAENLNTKAPQAEQIPGNVKAFADNYRTMPTAEIRRQSRYDTNPGAAKEFNFLRDEAIRLGLI